jgi:PAS domain S-box-containing protein
MNTVGESYWEHYGVPLRDEFGQIVGVIEIARNVTEKLKAEQALVRAKEDWENTFDAITDMVMLLDSEHRIIRANMATAKTLGITKENLVNKKCYEVVHGQSQPIERCPLVRTLKTLKAHTNEIIEPYIGGGTFICSTSPIVDQEGKLIGYTHTLKDITESKRLESKLQRAQKMEAIGTLAGGIAHDFNNLLTGILGNTSLMLLEADPLHRNYKRLKRIETQVLSGVKLTKQLLGYARKGRYEVKPLDLNQLVEETSETFGRTRKEITIHRKLAGDSFAIEADAGQIEQVLLNLFVNAADAMPNGGDLTLNTMNVTNEDMKDKPYVPIPGDYVLLKVTDTGIGMDKETKQRIFDPFFTTKGIGKGTGLGLASVYGIVKGHGGYINVESEKGQGATFYVYFPASKKKVTEDIKGVERINAGTGVILLIDDEPIVLSAGVDMLKETGYKVLEAKGGREAVKIYQENKNRINLVILDMIMPDMGGGETYNRIKAINPDVKVLLSSGYSINGQAARILERGCDGFIQKPFSMKELSSKVKDILEKK